jgi:acetyl-CoA carboxylase biotin carboxyl carrier protein
VIRSVPAWAAAQPAGHPARAAWDRAGRLAVLLAVRPDPVSVATIDPALWLAVWMVGRPVRWHADGLRGLAAVIAAASPGALPDPEAPALIWPRVRGEWVFSHRALGAAVEETAALGAHGRGLPGPLAAVQAWASWALGRPFGEGPWWRPHPEHPGRYTDGAASRAFAPELLGIYAGAGEIERPSTRQEGRRVRSTRLYAGCWVGREMRPDVFAGGWCMLETREAGGTHAGCTGQFGGNRFRVLVKVGDVVKPGQEVVTLESMKMEIPVESEVAGTVVEVAASEGVFVNEGDPLVIVDTESGRPA